MDAKLIEGLLHRVDKRHYKGRVGELVYIDFPPVPFTRDTEFLALKVETIGDAVEEPPVEERAKGEGLVLPSQIVRRGAKPGTSYVVVRAYDSLTQEEMAGVDPLKISIDIEK